MSVTEPTTKTVSSTSDLSTAVIKAVADATGKPFDELPLLYDVIDPDALDAIFKPRGDGRPRTGIHLTFTMAGCTVSIRDGVIAVTPNSATATEQHPAPLAQEN